MFAVAFLQKNFEDRWVGEVQNIVGFQRDGRKNELNRNVPPENVLDFGHFKSFSIKYKDLLLPAIGNKAHSLPTWLDDVTEIRNKVAHFDDVEEDEAIKARINMRQIAKLLGISELEEEILLEASPLQSNFGSRRHTSRAVNIDPLIEAEVRRHTRLSFKVNSGDEHRIMHSGLSGSLWIRPRYRGYRVATTGEVARLNAEIEQLIGPCTGVEDGKGYKFWYLDESTNVDKIIASLGNL